VYRDNGLSRPYCENDTLGGQDPYSASKAASEIAIASYRDAFLSAQGLALSSARAGNVIGGGDWSEDRLIPDAIRAWQAGRTLEVRRPEAIRPWQHVLEPLGGYLMLAECLLAQDGRCASAYNFGPGDEDTWPVERIANKLVHMWGNGAAWARDPEAGAHEAHYLRLDASKARMELGWEPKLKIETALEWTMAWYRAWHQGENMANFTATQIEDYRKLGAC